MRKILILIGVTFFCFQLIAQTPHAKGKVVGEDGQPLPGVTITNKKTSKIVGITDAQGAFDLSLATGTALVFSSVEFEPKEVSASESMSITLKANIQSLTEVVVTGVGSATSKKKLGIAVESVTASQLPQVPAATLDQALVGKIPGAQISTVSGTPGDKVNIVLRGINTVQGGTRPLVMLDGVEIPFENLTTLDLSQVERIEVVQGAASATIYGAQGANGVIQIFSKKGVKGRMSINVSSSMSKNSFINSGNFGKASLHPYLTDANGNIIYSGSNADLGYTAGEPITIDPDLGIILGSNSIAYRYGSDISSPDLPDPSIIPGLTQSYTRYAILDPRNKADQPYTGSLKYNDHFAEVFQNSTSRNNSISLNGGSDKIDFNLAFSNNHTTSPLLENNGYLDRTNLTANIGVELFKGFTVRSITNIAYTRNTMHPRLGAPGGEYFGQGDANADVNGVYGFLNTSPFFSLKDTITGGNYASFQRASFLSVNAFNPFYRLQYSDGDSKRYDVIQNIQVSYKVNKFAQLDAKYGISYKNENDIWTIYNQSLNVESSEDENM